ncbi:MAG: cell division topological specificity factor MinE [Chloroflexi bacterium]|nr:cell division topological specificity factor MinE [Chloroflexota bacterium]
MSFWDQIFRPRSTSSQVAKERLQVVLVHDRVKLSPELLETLKNEIIAVISKHVSIDQEAMEIKLTHGRGYQKLTADIPILGSRDSAAPRRPR